MIKHGMQKAIMAMVLVLGMAGTALAAYPVNINSASAEEISEALNGIGEVKAQAIVAWREANGPFTSVEQLAEVKGIGEKMLEKNRQYLLLE
ncbi:MAG TPA: helix-hairpin-helix domain-containing protein [Pseudomonadales bacterium]